MKITLATSPSDSPTLAASPSDSPAWQCLVPKPAHRERKKLTGEPNPFAVPAIHFALNCEYGILIAVLCATLISKTR